ncbi:MAG: ABC transporter permease [Nitrospina sp.]|jgi:microcin C transport system permease protein|nr:ABC transporter permease [Nitrospina sp.]MBT3510090.1 ABC transporter permease [Nitrospina sp.]MBT3877335.1 ABC transporter permease [Nitrospina sp.]MBT4046794.1 ABC transporter permease [Nitrospina sp.]MBT4557484.1 ABC transporter permease [Nitrospina sp.]
MLKLNKELKVKQEIFKKDIRAYTSFLILTFLFLATLPAELICNVRPIMIVVEGKFYFPITFTYSEKEFGGTLPSEPDYKSARFLQILKGMPEATQLDTKNAFGLEIGDFEEDNFSIGLDDFEDSEESITPPAEIMPTTETLLEPREFWALWPPIRYDYQYIPTESNTGNVVLAAPYRTPTPSGEGFIESSWEDGHYLGTDDRGRDVLARLIYGFRISMLFGASLAITGTLIGCLMGGTQGFFGGWVDLVGQRLTEIWGSIPRLYILIILSSFLVPSALLLFLILNLTAWMGIAAYIRAEFLKVRNFEFVKAAKGLGVSNFTIMRKHILPNALTPVVTFFPFEVTAGILALVSLDYLNLGVPSPAPSMGELLAQGKNNLQALWILLPTFTALTSMIVLLTFIGEGIRNAFDPRKTL